MHHRIDRTARPLTAPPPRPATGPSGPGQAQFPPPHRAGSLAAHALLVREIRAQQPVVIKPLDHGYAPLAAVSGASILDDGSVTLTLEPPALNGGERARQTARHAATAAIERHFP